MKRSYLFLLTAFALLAFMGLSSALKGQTSYTGTWSAITGDYTMQSPSVFFTVFSESPSVVQLASGELSKSTGQSVPYHNNGFRLYANNTITIAPAGSTITEIRYTFLKQGNKTYAEATLYNSVGTFVSGGTPTNTQPVTDVWTGTVSVGEKPIVIKLGNSGQRLLTQIEVTAVVNSGAPIHVTYDANGGSGTMTDPNNYVYGGQVTVLPNSFSYPGHAFDKWTTLANGSGSSYYPGDVFTIFDNTTLYAQWIDISHGVYDVLNPENVNEAIGSGTGYCDWQLACTHGEISTVYKGKSLLNPNAIQIAHSTSGSSRFSGIVTTETNGLLYKVQVVWNATTSNGRTLQVYGRQTPYASTEDLYNTNQGTLLGTIVKGSSTELVMDTLLQKYPYIGLRSSNGAMYLDEIRILWANVSIPSVIEFSPVAIDLGNVVVGQMIDTNFVVSQSNLGENISLSASYGTLNPVSIPRNANPTTVTWSYTPTTSGLCTVEITASSTWLPEGDPEPVTVTKVLPITMTVLDPNAGQALHTAKNSFVEALNTNPNATQSVAISLAGVQEVANSQVQVVGQQGQYLYLQDGERGLLVYGPGAPEFQTGDRFTSGTLMGTLTSYHGVVELVNFSFQDEETIDDVLEPVESLISDLNGSTINHEYEHRYVKIDNLNITVDIVNANNWIVANSGISLPLYDRFSVGYASKTHPESTDAFSVKGVYDPYYSSNANHYQLIPTALGDIHTGVKVGEPVFDPSGGTFSQPKPATVVTLTPASNTTMVYSVGRDDRLESNGPVSINLESGTTHITAFGTRDFYTDSETATYYYQLPSNVHSVNFMVNGESVDVAYAMYYNGYYNLSANQVPTVNDLGLFSFRYWSTSPDEPYNNRILDVTSYNFANEATTLYAVYGEASSYSYTRIINPSQISAGEYVIVGYDGIHNYPLKNTFSSGSPLAYTLDDLGLTENNDVLTGDNLSIVTWTFTGTPSEMTVTSTANPNHYLYLQNSSTGVRVGTTNTLQTWTVDGDNSQVETFNMKNNAYNRYLTLYNGENWRSYLAQDMYNTNSYPRLKLYKKLPFNSEGDPLYTRVFINEDGTGVTAIDEITIAGPSVIPSGSFLNMNGYLLNSSNADNFLIQDGAVFMSTPNNTDIKATVQKTIAGYGSDNTVQNGWYLLGSPVGLVNANGLQQQDGGQATGFYDAGETNYDLYRFDPSAADDYEWRNHKANQLSTVFGQWDGILYASQVNRILTFTGTLVTSCANQTFAYTGWNLIANPFTCPAYLGGSVSDYARMVENSGVSELQLAASGSPIAPMEGIFVETTGTGQTFSFTTAQNVGQNGQGMVNIEVVSNRVVPTGEEAVIDNARIRFGEGSMFGKYMLNKNGTKLYIPQGGKDYAVVRAQSEGEIPLNFKTSQNGSFTLHVNVEGVELNYLHLIDNMNGADIDLLAEPSYSFEARTTDYASRFRLVFSANDENGASTGSATFAYYNGSEWVISNMGEATLQVVDVMGRVLRTETINGNTTINLNQKSGVYMLRLVSGDSVKAQKVVVR